MIDQCGGLGAEIETAEPRVGGHTVEAQLRSVTGETRAFGIPDRSVEKVAMTACSVEQEDCIG